MVVESVVLIVAIILAVLVFLRFIPLNLWISALASGVHVSIFTLMGMRIRRVPPVTEELSKDFSRDISDKNNGF